MYNHRPRSTYPANYYPRYSEDPRYIGDPRYYGRGSPYSGAPQYGGQPPGKANNGVIFGCAMFCVFIIVVAMGALAVGLALGLSGDSSSSTGTQAATVVPIVTPASPVVDPNDGTDTDTDNPDTGGTDPLSITCPDNIQRFVPGSTSTAIVTWPTVDITGGVGVPTYTEDPVSGSSFAIRDTVVNIRVSDGIETVTCSFLVQVIRSGSAGSFLSATCPGDIVMSTDPGENSVAVNWDPPAVSNANGSPVITYSRARGSSFIIGDTTVVATVTDASATVQCDFGVTVLDGIQSLTLVCPGDSTVNTNPGETFATVNYQNPRVVGASGGVFTFQFDPVRNSPLPVGMTTVRASVTSGGTTASCTFRVTVQDNEAPVLSSCDPGRAVSTDTGRNYATITWITPTAVDNTGGSLAVTVSRSSPGQFAIGRHTVIATATDSNGNEGSCTWTYDVSDNEDPVVTCPASFTARLPSGSPNVVVSYEDLVSASDNIPMGLDVNVMPSDIYPIVEGPHSVVAIATDASGNTHSCSFTVTVSDFCGSGAMTLTPRIIGGQVAGEGEYPWQVSIFQGNHFCGAVVIDENWVITAAHCAPLVTPSVTQIIAGDTGLSTTSANRQTRSVAQVVSHPSYVSPPEYDIALLRLAQPLVISDYVLPACMATTGEEQDLYDSDRCYVAGWGTTDPDATDITAMAVDNLREVRLDVFTSQACQPYHSISENSICAGKLAGGQDACYGDSGGGLVCPDVDNLWHVIGLVSAGTGCALPNTAAVYTRVSQFLDFTYAYLGAELVVVDLNNMGSFSSPLAGSNYPNNVVKGWRFRRFGGRAIRLEFPEFELASGDTLTLGHGLDPWDTSTHIMTMRSTFSLVDLEVGSTDIWFRFVSNRSGVAKGFSIRVIVIT